MVAMALGILITSAAAMMFINASKASFLVTQRSTAQTDARAAINAISADLNLAGAGLQDSGISVPADAKLCADDICSLLTFPTDTNGNKLLYGVMPGPKLGPIAVAADGSTDILTIAYTDRSSNFAKGCTAPCGYDARIVTLDASGDTLHLQFRDPSDTVTKPPELPALKAPSPALDDSVVGFQPNDMVLVSNSHGQAIGVVTSVVDQTTLELAPNDPLNINATSGAGSIPALMAGNPVTTATKLNLVTYLLKVSNGADGVLGTSDDVFKLMRSFGAYPPVAVANQVQALRFSYGLVDPSLGNDKKLPPDLPLRGGQQPLAADIPNIRSVSVTVIACGNRESFGNGYQQVPATTTISPRSLSFVDQYKSSSGAASY